MKLKDDDLLVCKKSVIGVCPKYNDSENKCMIYWSHKVICLNRKIGPKRVEAWLGEESLSHSCGGQLIRIS
jgi:hypothetical protein